MARLTSFSVWSAVVALIFYLQVLPPILSRIIPFEWWMDINKIEVFDAVAGSSIRVAVDRSIYRDFRGTYVVHIRKITPTGFEAACSRGEERISYSRGAEFGSSRDLNWYMGIPPNAECYPPIDQAPGRYYAIVEHWIPILGGYVTLHNVEQTNVFSVYAPGQAPATEGLVQRKVDEAVTP